VLLLTPAAQHSLCVVLWGPACMTNRLTAGATARVRVLFVHDQHANSWLAGLSQFESLPGVPPHSGLVWRRIFLFV
jgi:hypothetical protein